MGREEEGKRVLLSPKKSLKLTLAIIQVNLQKHRNTRVKQTDRDYNEQICS